MRQQAHRPRKQPFTLPCRPASQRLRTPSPGAEAVRPIQVFADKNTAKIALHKA
jgi:hypothetical protein